MRRPSRFATCLLAVLTATPAHAALVHQWTFNGNAVDLIGSAHGLLGGNATIEGDRLSLDGLPGTRLLTPPLGTPLSAKTLVSWVSLQDASFSSKGSALTIQNNAGGDIFDAIVYGEVAPQRWMAGSNFFQRTQNPQEYGFEETTGEPGEVMVSIAYGSDGTITVYRDSEIYGSYKKGLQKYSGNAMMQIGPRHGNHNDVLAGFVNEARIYDTALTLEEIGAVFTSGPETLPNPAPPPPAPPRLLHQWTFDGTLADQAGAADGTLYRGAELTPDGRLSLIAEQGQYFRTAKITQAIFEKTLVAWGSLRDLEAPLAGSMLTLQNFVGTDVFDAIVYGERTPGQWMAGSEGFSRTPLADNNGSLETVTEPGEVMLAISYNGLGEITIYRDGVEYARYTSNSPPTYLPTNTDILIGPRHLDLMAAGGPNNFFDGLVNEARVYAGVLSADDIKAIAALGPGSTGDLDGDGRLLASDLDQLSDAVRGVDRRAKHDLNADGQVDQGDRAFWVETLKHSYFGDSNLDGQFNSTDFVTVFQAGQYEDITASNSTWATGDWNGDRDFSSADFVTAFQAGGYEAGPRPAGKPVQVPEPNLASWMLAAGCVLRRLVRRRGS